MVLACVAILKVVRNGLIGVVPGGVVVSGASWEGIKVAGSSSGVVLDEGLEVLS